MKDISLSGTAFSRTLESGWNVPSSTLELKDDEFHVWRASLDLPAWRIERLKQTLSPDEKARVERFYFDKHKRRFIACRGFLRIILGRYLNMNPGQIQFCYGSRGKPELSRNVSRKVLRFNVSHSNEMALYAVANRYRVGIDIERVRSDSDAEALSKRFFFPSEFSEIKSLSSEMKKEVFFRYWTVKEAYLKATGEGLAGLEHVEVSLSPVNSIVIQNIKTPDCKDNDWVTCQIIPSPGYVAAIVIENHKWESVQLWDIGKMSALA